MKHTLFLMLALLSGCGKVQKTFLLGMASAPAPLVVPQTGDKAIIMIGQSNGQGTGQAQIFPSMDRLDFTTARHAGPFYVAAEELLLKHPGWTTLRMVDCMSGGKPIVYFLPGTPNYNDCTQKVAALQSGGVQVIGLFFYQGESDARDPDIDWQWAQEFQGLIQSYRTALGIKNMPVVFAQLGQLDQDIYGKLQGNWKEFKKRQAALSDPYMAMVKTDDQPNNPGDDVHHGYDANVNIGERFFKAYLGLILE